MAPPPDRRRGLPLPQDKAPPQNLDAERFVLSAMLLNNNECVPEILALLSADDFYRDSHQVVFVAIKAVYDKYGKADGLMVDDYFRVHQLEERVGGLENFGAILNAAPTDGAVLLYAGVVKETSILRKTIDVLVDSMKLAYSRGNDASVILEEIGNRIAEIGEESGITSATTLHKASLEAIETITRRSQGVDTGIASNLDRVDKLIGGFKPGWLYIVAGRPSMGKSAFAVKIAHAAAFDQGKPVAIFSLEMAAADLAERILIMLSGVDASKVQLGTDLTPTDLAHLGDAYDQTRGVPIYIDDGESSTVDAIYAKCRKAMRKKPLGLIIIDYVQMMDAESRGRFGRRKSQSRAEEMARIAKDFRRLSRSLKVPVVVMSQLNRNVETRPNKKPMMSDLKESGGLEEVADVVLLLYRPEYYNLTDRPGECDIIVAKQRNGRTGTATVAYVGDRVMFADLDPHAQGQFAPSANGGPAF